MPVDKVRDILKIAQEPVSLETPIGEEEDSHLGDFIPDEDASEPSEAASFSLLKEQLMEVLDTLTPREKKVLELRFGCASSVSTGTALRCAFGFEPGNVPAAAGAGAGASRRTRCCCGCAAAARRATASRAARNSSTEA